MYWRRGEEEWRGKQRRGDAVGKWRVVGWGQGMAFITYGRKKKTAAAKKPRESEQRFSEL